MRRRLAASWVQTILDALMVLTLSGCSATYRHGPVENARPAAMMGGSMRTITIWVKNGLGREQKVEAIDRAPIAQAFRDSGFFRAVSFPEERQQTDLAADVTLSQEPNIGTLVLGVFVAASTLFVIPAFATCTCKITMVIRDAERKVVVTSDARERETTLVGFLVWPNGASNIWAELWYDLTLRSLDQARGKGAF